MKAGYGEPLRRLFSEDAWVESVVDFGHAKQIFEDADVFPSIIVARKPTKESKPTTARLCSIPREQLRIDDLSRQIANEGTDLPATQLSGDVWQLEPSGVLGLLKKVREAGNDLKEFASTAPYRGILTGLNDTFLIDEATRKKLVDEDPNCAEIMRPYVRGQDIDRWVPDYVGLSMIAIPSSGDKEWPWSNAGEEAESVYQKCFPSIHAWMKPQEAALRKRQDKGKFWWELRACAYWGEFTKSKIMYQDIAWRPQYCLDDSGRMSNNTVHFIVSDDMWILSVLNSPIAWWYSWRSAQHGKDEALRLFSSYMHAFPIPTPASRLREEAHKTSGKLRSHAVSSQQVRRNVVDWLRIEYEIPKPSMKLQSAIDLDSDAFVGEVKRIRGKKNPLSVAALKSLRDEHARTIEPARAQAAEALALERRLSDLVNEAYGLTPEEVALMWQTAPPRMPFLPA